MVFVGILNDPKRGNPIGISDGKMFFPFENRDIAIQACEVLTKHPDMIGTLMGDPIKAGIDVIPCAVDSEQRSVLASRVVNA